MAKSLFADRFQINLRNQVEYLLHNDWGRTSFQVVYEGGKELPGSLAGRGDIIITDTDNPLKVLAIEIEHLSSYEQSKQNISKFKYWAHNSHYRACGLLHIFNEGCKLNEDQICYLLESAKINERKGLGFSYDVFFYNISDKRQYRKLAEDIVLTKEFRVRLWQLLINLNLVRNR